MPDSSRPKGFKSNVRGFHGDVTYYFEDDVIDPGERGIPVDPYQQARDCQEQYAFDYPSYDLDMKLDHLQAEIHTRIKITKNEIFKIGELLVEAKKVCQEKGLKFQEWISDNFDFSYETANNFMNVYKNCLGQRKYALKLSPSILYKISAPNFPEELRDYLFEQGQLDEMSNGKLRKITQKYKEGGFEAVQEDVERLNKGALAIRQTQYTFDMVENALRTLEQLKQKMEGRGRGGKNIIGFEDAIQSDEEEAREINSKLYSTLKTAIETLDQAKRESEDMLGSMIDKLQERCDIAEPDGRIEKRKQAELSRELGESEE